MNRLKSFKDDEVILTQDQAFDVLRFFWPHMNTKPSALTVKDRKFAQALLIEAIDSSYAMGYIESVFRSFAKIGIGLQATIKSFAKKAIKHWFQNVTRKDIMDNPKIYEIIRQRLDVNFRSIWAIREATGNLTY